MARARESDGHLTLQDLVDIKLEVARLAGVTSLQESSRLETALVFLRAGGDLTSQTVSTNETLRLLAGQRPGVDVVVTPGDLDATNALADWSGAAELSATPRQTPAPPRSSP